jgi:hypothetical protein
MRPEESNKESITSFILNQIMKILREIGVPNHSELEPDYILAKGNGNASECRRLSHF